jgi:molybdopterin converting factor small subunit
MSVRIELAHVLAELADGHDVVTLEPATAGTVGAALRSLGARYPRLDALLWRGGAFNDQLVAFLNRENVRHLQALETPVRPGDTLMLITAVEGGQGAPCGSARGALRVGERATGGGRTRR